MSVPTTGTTRMIACSSGTCGVARHEMGSTAHTACLSAAARAGRGPVSVGAPPALSATLAAAQEDDEGAAPLDLDDFPTLAARRERLTEGVGDAVDTDDAAAYLESLGWTLAQDSPHADIAEALSEVEVGREDEGSSDEQAAEALVFAGAYLDAGAAARGIAGDRESFVRGYSESMMWTRMADDESGDGFHVETGYTDYEEAMDSSDVASMAADAGAFYDANAPELVAYARRRSMDGDEAANAAGHDFALTRNHHGAGFWDRGVGSVGDRLTSASHAYGAQQVMAREDGTAYVL